MKGWSWRNSKTSLFLKVNRCLHLKQGWAESIVLMLRTEVITRMLHLTRIYLLSAIGLVASHPHCQAPVNTHAHTHTEGTRGLVAKSCPTLANPWTIAHQVPLSISQGRTLEWVAISFSSGSSWLRGRTQGFCISGYWAMREARKAHMQPAKLRAPTRRCVHTHADEDTRAAFWPLVWCSRLARRQANTKPASSWHIRVSVSNKESHAPPDSDSSLWPARRSEAKSVSTWIQGKGAWKALVVASPWISQTTGLTSSQAATISVVTL